MRRGVLIALALLSLTVGPGQADAPDHSPVPPARAADMVPVFPPNTGPAAGNALPGAPHPQPRPVLAPAPQTPQAQTPQAQTPQTQTPQTQALNSVPALASSLRPMPRPKVKAAASPSAATAPATSPKAGYRGALCGDAALTGAVLAPVTSRVKGCGISAPVSVEFVAGVRLNPAATIDCTTAEALKSWVKTGLQPAFSPRKVVELRIFGSYTCRGRNNVKSAKLSEHGKGKAVDIGAFVMDNGQTWTVLDNYNKTIRKAQKAACGPFQTTLGPGSDGFHENHLHLDTASYRYGPYCH